MPPRPFFISVEKTYADMQKKCLPHVSRQALLKLFSLLSG